MSKIKLNFELIPSGAWNFNLRTQLTKKAWDFIRKTAYSESGFKCKICGANAKRLEAHEKWHFDKDKHIQKLEDVVAVCHNCHLVIHIGRTQLLGQEDRAIAHFKKVNNLDYQGYISCLKKANEENIELSKIDDWVLDLEYLKRYT